MSADYAVLALTVDTARGFDRKTARQNLQVCRREREREGERERERVRHGSKGGMTDPPKDRSRFLLLLSASSGFVDIQEKHGLPFV